MKKYLVEVMIIIMIIFIAFWAYVKVTITDEVIVEIWNTGNPLGSNEI